VGCRKKASCCVARHLSIGVVAVAIITAIALVTVLVIVMKLQLE